MYFPPVLAFYFSVAAVRNFFFPFLTAGGRTLRLVRRDFRWEIKFYVPLFPIPFILMSCERKSTTNIMQYILLLPYVHQIFTSDCTLHQQTEQRWKKIYARHLLLLEMSAVTFRWHLFLSLLGRCCRLMAMQHEYFRHQARPDFNKVTKN